MKYRILGQLRGPRGYARCIINAPVPPGTGQEWLEPVRGVIELEKSGEVYTARGSLASTVSLPCSRCAVQHPVRIQVEVDETVALNQIDESASYQEEDKAAGPIPLLNQDMVDLSELVRQMLVLHVPARSLCRPECKGLCPYCGADLNKGECQCAVEQIDPRLEPLRKLL